MSRKSFNIFLIVLALLISIIIIKSIKGPIEKQKQVDKIEAMVINKLEEIKKAQMAYKEITDTFANNFDDLILVIKKGKIKKFKKLGGKAADTMAIVKVDTLYVDALAETFGMDYNIDNLGKVPPMNQYLFKIEVGTLISNEIRVPLFQVTDPKPINPKRSLKIGSLTDAIYTGNWK